MEKKTIGAFLAALRKANGLTQKQLADMLGVSDKAVSRWERDECAPDLTLIPVLAEIFGVTCDELLRGERHAPGETSERSEKKTDKQFRNALNQTMTRFRTRSTISIGLALLGLIAAMICNFGFNRGYLGFFVGTIFYLAAVLTEGVFLNLAYSSVDSEEFEGEALRRCKKSILRLGLGIISGAVVLFAATLPLVLKLWDPYLGLNALPWLMSGLYCGAVAAVLCFAVCWAVDRFLGRKNGWAPVPDPRLTALRRKILAAALAVLAVTFVAQWAFNQFTQAISLYPGISFDNWDDFKTYMETPTTEDGYQDLTFMSENSGYGMEVYMDQNGYYYQFWPEPIEITDADGKVLCEIVKRNEYVWYLGYGSGEDLLPVTVYTVQQRWDTYGLRNFVNVVFCCLYVAEAGVFIAVYQKKKRAIG